jgi:sec-independent protein translocase protein TatA
MNVFGIGLPELAVIAAIGLLVFGPKRLPELGKTLGRTLRGFQTASQEFEKEFRNAVASSDPSLDPDPAQKAIPPAVASEEAGQVVEVATAAGGSPEDGAKAPS